MKILITGANGYIGRNIVMKLVELKNEVICIDVKFDNIDDIENIIKIKKDIFNENITDLYRMAQCPDVLLHLAWVDGFNLNSESHIKMISSHYMFIESLIGQGLKRICVMGSMHEVGYHLGMIDEFTESRPVNLYGISKYFLRNAIAMLCNKKGICFQWARAYYIVGDDKKNNSIFKKILAASEKGEKTFPFTTGEHKFDFIDMKSFTKQMCSLILQDEINGIIDICSGIPVSLSDKTQTFIKENDLDIKLIYGVYPERDDESPIVYGDISKIERILKADKSIN